MSIPLPHIIVPRREIILPGMPGVPKKPLFPGKIQPYTEPEQQRAMSYLNHINPSNGTLSAGLDEAWELEEGAASARVGGVAGISLAVTGTVSQSTGIVGNCAGVASGSNYLQQTS